MNYEIEQKLRSKVDDWQHRALEQTVDNLKRDNAELERKVDRLQSKVQNYYDALEHTLRLLIEHHEFVSYADELQGIRQSL